MVLTPIAQGFAVVMISGAGIVDKFIMAGKNDELTMALRLGVTFTAAQEVVQAVFSRIMNGQVEGPDFQKLLVGVWAPIVDKTLYNSIYSAVLVKTPVLEMIGSMATQMNIPYAQPITLGVATSLASFLRTGIQNMAVQYNWPWMIFITNPVAYTQHMLAQNTVSAPGTQKKAGGMLN